jgi:hypothetical protein
MDGPAPARARRVAACLTATLVALGLLATDVRAAVPSNTVLPVVTGTARDNQTLTSTAGSWSTTTAATYTRAWSRCDALGASCLPIPGAAATSYRLTPADVGATIRVRVTATNADGPASADSAQTAQVVPAPVAASAPPAITGTARDGQTLTAGTGTWSGTPAIVYAHQWQRCDTLGGNCADLAGATATTYALRPGDIGTTLKVRVTATNAVGSATSTSAKSATVTAAPPSNTALPAVTGAPVQDGQVLSADPGTWTGTPAITYAYQWKRCPSTSCTSIAGATLPDYALTPADVGAAIQLLVTARNSAGSATATALKTVPVTPVSPAVATAPQISGATVDGETLTVTTGSWTGTPALVLARQWLRCDALGATCLPIPGATGTSYVLTGEDVDATVRVRVTATNAAGSATATTAATAGVAPVPPFATAVPVITGTARDGDLLSATAGTWTGTLPRAYAYQWRRCDAAGAACADLPGETGPAYRAVPADVDRTLRVLVTAANSGGSATATSSRTTLVAALAPANLAAPAITPGGTPRDGWLLTADPGDWRGTPAIGFAYQWQRCDAAGAGCADIPAATQPTYLAATADVAARVRVVVTASNAGGAAVAASVPTGQVQPNPPVGVTAPTIEGIAEDQATLVARDGSWSGLVPMTMAYRWERCDAAGANCSDIPGAVAADYVIGGQDVGLTVRVRVTATNAGGSASQRSAPTAAVTGSAPRRLALPVVTGYTGVGRTLTADRGSWAGSPTLAYAHQWERCDAAGDACADIDGADRPAYALTGADLGHRLRVRVTATNGLGTTAAQSDATRVVTDDPPVAVSAPSLSFAGVLAERTTLTADPGEWDGGAPISTDVRWQRCEPAGAPCADIPDAIGPAYALAAADVGKRIRAVTLARNFAGEAEGTSETSGLVLAAPPVSTGPPAVTITGPGAYREGQQLSASAGSWSGALPIAYTFAWLRCDAQGAACAPIPGAVDPTYTVTGDDVTRRLRVQVTARNTTAETAATSGPTVAIAGIAPATAAAPAVVADTGKARQGSVLRVIAGTWTGTAPIALAYRWQRCEGTTVCETLPGQTGERYVVGPDDVGRRIRVLVEAANVAGETIREGKPTDVIAAMAPSSVVRPVVILADGVARDGARLRADGGQWNGSAPVDLKLQWQRCSAQGSCQAIKGATEDEYVLGAKDVSSRVQVLVTAKNGGGQATRASLPTEPVQALEPRNRRRPVIVLKGSELRAGVSLQAKPGDWSGTEPLKLSYRWQKCRRDGTRCQDIAGAEKDTYTVTAADASGSVRVVVSAENAAGSAEATSVAAGALVRPRFALAARALKLVGRTRMALTLACSQGPIGCSGTATLRGTGVKRTLRVRLAAGASKTTKMKLTKAARRALARGRLTVAVRVRLRVSGGPALQRARRYPLRVPKRASPARATGHF